MPIHPGTAAATAATTTAAAEAAATTDGSRNDRTSENVAATATAAAATATTIPSLPWAHVAALSSATARAAHSAIRAGQLLVILDDRPAILDGSRHRQAPEKPGPLQHAADQQRQHHHLDFTPAAAAEILLAAAGATTSTLAAAAKDSCPTATTAAATTTVNATATPLARELSLPQVSSYQQSPLPSRFHVVGIISFKSEFDDNVCSLQISLSKEKMTITEIEGQCPSAKLPLHLKDENIFVTP